MLPLWHTHVFGTSIHLRQHTLLCLFCLHDCPCHSSSAFSFSLDHWSSNSVSVSQLNIRKDSGHNAKSRISLLVERYSCCQSACFLPLHNTNSYLPQQVSAILGSVRYSFSIRVSLPWIFFHCKTKREERFCAPHKLKSSVSGVKILKLQFM